MYARKELVDKILNLYSDDKFYNRYSDSIENVLLNYGLDEFTDDSDPEEGFLKEVSTDDLYDIYKKLNSMYIDMNTEEFNNIKKAFNKALNHMDNLNSYEEGLVDMASLVEFITDKNIFEIIGE